jgi:hypothetical protein
MASLTAPPQPPPTTAPEAPHQPGVFNELSDPGSVAIATIALRNGSEPRDNFLSLTNKALEELTLKHPNLTVIVYEQQGQQSLPIQTALDIAKKSGIDLEIGLPYSENTAKALQAMQEAMFPDGVSMGVEEATLRNHSFTQFISPEERRAEADFYETLKKCELPREQYDAWIHRYKADFGFNQSELHEGAWLQISLRHLKHLAKTNPGFAVMCRNEELPIEPSKRWKATSVKTALHIEKEARKNDPESSKRSGSNLTRFYVYCADPGAALEISLQKTRISHSTMAAYDRLQTLKTFQGAVVAFGLIATAVSSLFQEAVTENVRKLLPPKEPLPVVKLLEEEEKIPRMALKHQVEPPSAVDHALNESSTIRPTNTGFSSAPNPLRPTRLP